MHPFQKYLLFDGSPLLIHSWCVFLQVEICSPSFSIIQYDTHAFVDSDDILIWNRESKLRVPSARSCMLVYLGIRTCCNGVVLVTWRDGYLAVFGLLVVHSNHTNRLQSFFIPTLFHCRLTTSTSYEPFLSLCVSYSIADCTACCWMNSHFCGQRCKYDPIEGDTGMHLNQSLGLVVDINRMHLLCMNAGPITLASTMCPYMGLENMIYFCDYHGPLRDFLPGYFIFWT